MGLLVVLIIMGDTAMLMCATYKYHTGESLLKTCSTTFVRKADLIWRYIR